MRSMLRKARVSAIFPSGKRSILVFFGSEARVLCRERFLRTPEASFVLPLGIRRLSSSTISVSRALAESAMAKARIAIFLLIFFEKFRSLVGPCVIPPPRQIGERIDPWRAPPPPLFAPGLFSPPPPPCLFFFFL